MKKRNFFTILAALALVFGLVAATLAYFTDRDEATNVFTMGNIAVEIHEDNAEDSESEDYLANDDYREWLADQTLLPGAQNGLPKQVHFKNTGSNDSYIRARLLIPKHIMDDNLLTLVYSSSPLWGMAHKVETTETVNGTLYHVISIPYLNVVPAGTSTTDLLEGFYMRSDADQDDLEGIDAEDWHITVQVEAIQADGFADVHAAFVAFDAQ